MKKKRIQGGDAGQSRRSITVRAGEAPDLERLGRLMPIFKCSQCGMVENTAVCNYWTDAVLEKKPPLCSECDPAIGKWHGMFERVRATGYKLGNDGFLYEPELLASGSFDNMIRAGLKIIG